MTEPERRAVHLRIEGRVQGVWYRGSMAEQARQRRLAGWVRNCPDGSVEARVEGASNDVAELVAWSRQGPPAANVEEVRVEEVRASGLKTFSVRY